MILEFLEKLICFGGAANMRFVVTMQEDFVKRMDEQARLQGLSRSAYISMVMSERVQRDELRQGAFTRLAEKKENK